MDTPKVRRMPDNFKLLGAPARRFFKRLGVKALRRAGKRYLDDAPTKLRRVHDYW